MGTTTRHTTDGEITITRADLTATTLSLGVFAVFATWNAVQDPQPISLTLGFLGGILLVATTVLWLRAPSPAQTTTEIPILAGTVPAEIPDHNRTSVNSTEELVTLAADHDTIIRYDSEAQRSYVLTPDLLYVCDDAIQID